MAISFLDSLNSSTSTASVATTSSTVEDDEEYTLCDDGRYLIYSNYVDEDFSTVDNLKNITTDSKQINLTQEENSQVIPFKIPRYWDGIDLMNMFIQIRFQNSSNKGLVANAINVHYNSKYIKFYWLVDANVTALAGTVKFEIMATGVNEKNEKYIWRTKPTGKLTITEGLNYDGIVEPTDDWYTSFVNMMLNYVSEAKGYADSAEESANSVNVETIQNEIADSLETKFNTKLGQSLENYYTKETLDLMLEDIDTAISKIDSLKNLAVSYNDVTGILTFKDGDTVLAKITINSLANLKVKYEVIEGKGKLTFLNGTTEITNVELSEINPSEEWTTNFKNEILTETKGKIETITNEIKSINNKIINIDAMNSDIDILKEDINTVKSDLLTSNTSIEKINNDITVIKNEVSGTNDSVASLASSVTEIENKVENLSTGNEYDVSYKDNIFTFYENEEIKKQFTITGGSGGTVEATTVTIERITDSNTVLLMNESAIIEYNFTSVDNIGDTTGNGVASWKIGNTTVATSTAIQGKNSFDITKYLKTGVNNIKLIITDSFGTLSSKTWSVTLVEFKIDSLFDDSLFYFEDVTFRYTPYGDVSKNIIFKLDGKEIGGVTTSVTGRQLTKTIPKQSHGSHLLEVYMTAEINGKTVTSESIYKDIIWIEEGNETPIIGCALSAFESKQYNTTTIKYVVYDLKNNPSNIELYVNDELVSSLTVDRTSHIWSYKTKEVGSQTLKIKCGSVEKRIAAYIEELDIDVKPVETNLVFDFNPSGKSNNDTDWLKINEEMSLIVSNDFDTTNGGYQIDEDGDTYFCVKAGNIATIPYYLFADDAKKNGKNFKLIYKTTNVKDYDATALSCFNSNIGFVVNAQSASLTTEQNSISVPYCENSFMELEFNILPDSQYKEIVMWINAIPTRIKLYSSTDSFTQVNPVGITIGSENCDVHIYRIKSYSMNLTDDEILDNYIADAKNAEVMIERYNRNQIVDANGSIDPDILAEKHPELRIIKMSVPYFATSKTAITGCTIQHIYKGGRENEDNWIAYNCSHKGQGTSSIAYGESALNVDISLDEGLTLADGTVVDKYAMTENSIAENYFNIKVNVASSENANNAILADEYNIFNPYIRSAKQNDSRVRDTMEFHPCVIFVQETDTSNSVLWNDGQYHFYACGDFGNSKKNKNTMGMNGDNHKEFIVEVLNNTDEQTRFLSDDLSEETWDGDGSFEFRYSNKACTAEELQAGKDAWQRVLSWVVNCTPETFVSEFEDYFVKDSVLFFYLFTERHCMVDNRAKNTFWHTEDLIHWDICFDYDNDTAEGNDNEGGLTLTYGYEDTDMIGTKAVFNAYDSKLWCYVRDYLADELVNMYIKLEARTAWSASRLIKKYEDYQMVKPEKLWITDMRRKYFRVFEDNGNDRFLAMMHGDKREQRRQFETYQEKYIASKYLGSTCTSNVITIRGYTPSEWVGVKPDGAFNIVPYADTYIATKHGNKLTKIRGKRGQSYEIKSPIEAMNDTEVYVYNASIIRSVGDISAFYAGYTDFGQAEKITNLSIGSNVEGYINTNMESFDIGNNILLEYLNLQNLPNLKQTISLVGCSNLIEFLAEGSGITGVVFAPGGKIETAHLPAISSFTAKNLNYLTDLQISDYETITTLSLDNCKTINELDFLDKAINLSRVRLTGINWKLSDTTMLDRLAKLAGIDENGYNTIHSVLEGTVYVPVMRQQKLEYYNSLWENLKISYDTMITQYAVTFVNDDEQHTVLDIQYVDKGESAVDPITRTDSPIAIPTKESTISTDYTYSGWDDTFTNIFSNKTITATYTETTRQYTIRYISKGTVLQEKKSPYGDSVEYEGDTPTYTAEESAYKFYLFSHWDSSGYVDGDKTINAVFDICEYSEGCFDNKKLSDMSQVELYAMMKVGIEQDKLTIKDSLDFKLGVDYTFDDIEEREIISEQITFDGTNKIDTGISFLNEDRDFTLAIDFSFGADNASNATLAQCFQNNGSNGFRLWMSSEPKLSWGTAGTSPSGINDREIIVLRHKKGESVITVFNSNLSGDSITTTELTAIRNVAIDSTLVLGCAKADDGEYENYAKGIIYWCKLWYADLGDSQCKKLASWTHETIPMEIAKFKGYYMTEASTKRANITFLASSLLETAKEMKNGSSSNKGGWAESDLNKWLNTRLYGAISPLWKALIKSVKVSSNIGEKSTEISQSDCYFFIPSVYEINNSFSYEPYINETNSTISYMVSAESRKRARLSDPNTYKEYFTRTPNVNYSTNTYYYGVAEDGNTTGYMYTSNTKYTLIMFSIGV